MKDLTGQKFGRLTAISAEQDFRWGRNVLFWFCKCDCGGSKKVLAWSLSRGVTNSCGCLEQENRITHGQTGTSMYRIWSGIVQRCTNPKSKAYCWYGGRGIKICDRWLKFENFLFDMGDRPAKHTIERINTNGDYEKDNCRWATMKEQARNTSRNIIVEFKGERRCLQDWAKFLGYSHETLRLRLIAGWSVDDAFTITPKKGNRKP